MRSEIELSALQRRAITKSRLAAGLSMRELAREADVDPMTVSRLEGGQRSIDIHSLRAICRRLGLRVTVVVE